MGLGAAGDGNGCVAADSGWRAVIGSYKQCSDPKGQLARMLLTARSDAWQGGLVVGSRWAGGEVWGGLGNVWDRTRS